VNVRIVINSIIAIIVFGAGMWLLLQDSFFLKDRWNPGAGTLFSGWPLYLLALGLFLLAAFTGSVARAWLRQDIPLLPPKTIRPHPVYKGHIIFRFWYLVIPALISILMAFLLAERI
jgi:hypothetical protein